MFLQKKLEKKCECILLLGVGENSEKRGALLLVLIARVFFIFLTWEKIGYKSWISFSPRQISLIFT